MKTTFSYFPGMFENTAPVVKTKSKMIWNIKIVYNGLIKSHMENTAVAWGCSNNSKIIKICILQKKVAIERYNSDPISHNLGILKF